MISVGWMNKPGIASSLPQNTLLYLGAISEPDSSKIIIVFHD